MTVTARACRTPFAVAAAVAAVLIDAVAAGADDETLDGHRVLTPKNVISKSQSSRVPRLQTLAVALASIVFGERRPDGDSAAEQVVAGRVKRGASVAPQA